MVHSLILTRRLSKKEGWCGMLNLLFYRTNLTGIGSGAVYVFGSSAYMGWAQTSQRKASIGMYTYVYSIDILPR